MIVNYSFDVTRIEYLFIPDSDDKIMDNGLEGNRTVFYNLPKNTKMDELHNDHLALTAIQISLPFISKELIINWPISKNFEKIANTLLSKIKIVCSDYCIEYIPNGLSRPVLAYSGGADSTATLAVMPQNTIPIFLLRAKSKVNSLYNPAAALKSCHELSNIGYEVIIVESNFEFLRNPIGFPTDLAVGSPAILLAGPLKLSSIAFGTILESTYGIGGKLFREYTDSSHFRLWNGLFNAAGLIYSLPVAGISEVGTSKILLKTPYGDFSQSCIRGEWLKPCLRCWKCFRKSLLDSQLLEISFNDSILPLSSEVMKRLTIDLPMKHENVLRYSLNGNNYDDMILNNLDKFINFEEEDYSYLGRWFSRSSSLIDENYKIYTSERIKEILGMMSSVDEQKIFNWTNYHDEDRIKRLNTFISSIQE